jgi:hypothetical protein
VVAERDLVGFGDGVGFDGPEALTKTLASLPQELE